MVKTASFGNQPKESMFKQWNEVLKSHGFNVVSSDSSRPWGGFLVINEAQAEKFIETFFDEEDPVKMQKEQKLSPKILIVEPHKRLSWQYHERRAEAWKVVEGPVGFIQSETDEMTEAQELQTGDFIQFRPLIRHRLVGLEDFGVIAELWQHTDPDNPSEEKDIRRVQDDYGR